MAITLGLGLLVSVIFSTQSTNGIIGYAEFAQKIRFSTIYADRRQWTIKHFHTAGRNVFGSSTEHFHECACRLQVHPKT